MNIVDTTVKLMSFQTVEENKREIDRALKYIEKFFDGLEIKIRRFERNGVKSILLYLKDDDPKIVLHGHIDVIAAPTKDMFEAKIIEGKLYGRGSNDMKAAIAVMMHLLKDLSERDEKPDVGLLITSDEEVGGSNGSAYVLEEGLNPEFFVSGEPTALRIGNRAKGIINLKISVKGKGAHAARMWEGSSAILKIIDAIKELESLFPAKGDYYTTINIGKVVGGEAINKVAENCSLYVDIRHIPEEDPQDIINKIRRLDLEVEVLETGSPAYCPEENEFVSNLKKSLESCGIKAEMMNKNAASDARHFTKKSIPAIVFGPKGYGSHSPDEYVEISSLDKYYKVLEKFLD